MYIKFKYPLTDEITGMNTQGTISLGVLVSNFVHKMLISRSASI